MAKKGRLMKMAKKYFDVRSKIFMERYSHNIIDFFDIPVKIILSPFTLVFDIAGSAPRGFGVPEFVSNVSSSAIFAVGTFATYNVALELFQKVLCRRKCGACNGWQALRCTMCKGTGMVHFQVKNYTLKRGERASAECIADAISDNRAEFVHIPSAVDPHLPLPSKDCPACDGSGIMSCPECKDTLQYSISADDIMVPPWKAYNVLKWMDYPYEHIAHSMKDPSIAAFWLITMPEIMGGFSYDDDIKQKIWWQYKESMRYDHLRDVVAKREPGWETLQEALVSVDPYRARDDPIIVKNIPFYKAKKVLESEVMKLDVPPRPHNWGDLSLPLDVSSWSAEDLKDPKKKLEMKVLLNAQREMANKLLDTQWETKWREDKISELLEEKVRPYIRDNGILPQPFVIKPQQEKRKKRWWLF